MLRFDIKPVFSNVVRVEAIITSLVFILAIFNFWYLLPIIIFQSFIRGFLDPHKCFSHRIIEFILNKKNIAGKKENAGAKMFAQKLLFIASSISLFLILIESSLQIFPLTAILIFSTLEWSLNFCIACWAYSFFYKLKSIAKNN